jgi:hypothetical protein
MPSLPTFRQAAERWLATYPALAGLRQSTVEGHERALKLYAYPRFGDKLFIEVRREDIRQLVAEMVTADPPALDQAPAHLDDSAPARTRRSRRDRASGGAGGC